MDFNAAWALTKKKFLKDINEMRYDIIRLIKFLRSCDHDQNGGILYQMGKRLMHLPILGWKLKTDVYLKPKWATISGDGAYYIRETWTRETERDLSGVAYRRCSGLHDNLIWWGVPIYCRIHGGMVPDNRGNLQTASTLYNSYRSNATKEFKRSIGRGSLPAMDLQKIILLSILGGGAVLGLYFLGVI